MNEKIVRLSRELRTEMIKEIDTRKMGIARFDGKFFFTILSLLESREPEKLKLLDGYKINRLENLVFWYMLWTDLINKTIADVIAEGGTHAIE